MPMAWPPEGRGDALCQRGVRSGLCSRHHGCRGEAVQGGGTGPVERAPDAPVLVQQQRSQDWHCPSYLGNQQPVHQNLDTCMHKKRSRVYYPRRNVHLQPSSPPDLIRCVDACSIASRAWGFMQ